MVVFLILFITYTASSITIGSIWLFAVLVVLLLMQIALTFASVQRLTVANADCGRPWRRYLVSGAGRRRRRLELQKIIVTFGTDHGLPVIGIFLLGLFVRVMLQRLESFVLPIPVMVIVVHLFKVGSRLELVVQLPGIAAAIAAGAVLVMTVRWSWRSLFVVFPPYRGLWTALEWWTGMIRQGTVRLTSVLVELIVTVD